MGSDVCTSGTVTRPSPTPPPPTPEPSPTPVPPPTPSPAPGGCPGGSLKACVHSCPSNPVTAYKDCVNECEARCDGSSTTFAPATTTVQQCGNDDGTYLKHCVQNCPSDAFQACVICCQGKFPATFTV